MKQITVLLLAALLLAGCKDDPAPPPPPVDMTEDALSFFCQMNMAEHPGPKGQIHLEGYPDPLFFAQVRDVIAYLKSPERSAPITAVYVSDMGQQPVWATPVAGNWIAAAAAHYVVGAPVAGGMGAPEIVPFATRAAAQAFVTTYGGSVMALDAIPAEAALGAFDLDQPLETPS